VGDLLFCALAAQQQGQPADEAVEERTNYALTTHNQYKSTYRPKNCKTFVRKIRGHTASSVAVASVLHELYGLKVGLLAYAVASVVAWRMMDEGDHWASDVLFGATLGWVIGHTVARRHATWRSPASKSSPTSAAPMPRRSACAWPRPSETVPRACADRSVAKMTKFLMLVILTI
jgi:hypothetical protein